MNQPAVAALRVLLAGFSGLVLLYLILPMLVVAPLSLSAAGYLSFPPIGFSLRWYSAAAADDAWRAAAWNSAVIGAPTALCAMALGTLSAIAVARGGLSFARVIGMVVLAPMMLPHIVIAIGLYPVLTRLGLTRGYIGVILGHTVVTTPLVFITVTAALRSYSPSFELAAMTLGAGPWNTFRFVTLPMIRTGLVVGGVFAFATSLDELILALFLTNARTRTLPRLIWEQMSAFLTPEIAAVATVILAASFALLLMATLFGGGRRMSSSHG
jgi:putative spermidine/putrescine transport system permease protein